MLKNFKPSQIKFILGAITLLLTIGIFYLVMPKNDESTTHHHSSFLSIPAIEKENITRSKTDRYQQKRAQKRQKKEKMILFY